MTQNTSILPQRILTASGKGARIAVLDSGRNPEFPKLAEATGTVFDCILNNTSLVVRELPQSQNSDRCEHGSIVESCIRNVAPDAAIDHYRILDASCTSCGELLCATLEEVVKRGYHIVNLSLGTRNERHLPQLVNLLKEAYEHDVTLVASASNLGASVYPARFPYCLSATAADTRHALDLQFSPRNVIEFAGWGIDIPVEGPNDEILRVTGSSYAAAHITGLAARAHEVLGNAATPLDIKILLRNYARLINERKTPQAS
jgi:subtilisin family serine protease